MVCPVCTIAVAVGIPFLRELGVDDFITGVWYGALVISATLWMLSWIKKKQYKIPDWLTWLLAIIIFIIPLYPVNLFTAKFMGGVVLGSALFGVAVLSDTFLRKLNEGKQMIMYQKVIIPLSYLIISSIIIWLVIGILQ